MEILKYSTNAPHGEPDGGAIGASGTLEKDINLAVILKIQELLENQGVKVILTRQNDNGLHNGEGSIRRKKIQDMHKRLDIIKSSNADLFLSIHMNSFEDSSLSGIHVFYDKKHTDIKMLAEKISNNMSEITYSKNHEVKEASNTLYLMKNTPIPAILVECGFISNPEEEKYLNDDVYQSKIAWSITKTICEYYNIGNSIN